MEYWIITEIAQMKRNEGGGVDADGNFIQRIQYQCKLCLGWGDMEIGIKHRETCPIMAFKRYEERMSE